MQHFEWLLFSLKSHCWQYRNCIGVASFMWPNGKYITGCVNLSVGVLQVSRLFLRGRRPWIMKTIATVQVTHMPVHKPLENINRVGINSLRRSHPFGLRRDMHKCRTGKWALSASKVSTRLLQTKIKWIAYSRPVALANYGNTVCSKPAHAAGAIHLWTWQILTQLI